MKKKYPRDQLIIEILIAIGYISALIYSIYDPKQRISILFMTGIFNASVGIAQAFLITNILHHFRRIGFAKGIISIVIYKYNPPSKRGWLIQAAVYFIIVGWFLITESPIFEGPYVRRILVGNLLISLLATVFFISLQNIQSKEVEALKEIYEELADDLQKIYKEEEKKNKPPDLL